MVSDRGTARPTLFVANFDFDDRLSKPTIDMLPANLRAVNERLAPVLRSLCGPDDAVALLGQPVSHAGRFARVEPWGVEPHVLRWLGTLGLRPDALDRLPDPTAVRAVNGRRFQFANEAGLGVLPEGAVLCQSPAALDDAVAALPAGWVIKAEHGGSGRGVRLGDGPLPPRLAAWAGGVFARGQCVTAEPRERGESEISAHFTVGEAGVTFDGLCRLWSTPTGGFHRVDPLADPAPALLTSLPVWTAVAEAARARGYRGFLGVDAATRDGLVVRPVRDVNARWTMGRVALANGRGVDGL